MDKIETSNFKRLIGVWKTEGTILTNNYNSKLIGTDSYEFILNGHYILHKADVKMGNEKSQTFEIIAIDNSTEKAIMQFYNSKGESGSMTSSLIENNFKIKGDKIKFEGTINSKNTEIVGKWFLQSEDNKWTESIDLKLTSLRNKN
jgi:hypothetical protein